MLQMLSTLAPRVPPGPGLRLPRALPRATWSPCSAACVARGLFGASSEAEACGAARMCLPNSL